MRQMDSLEMGEEMEKQCKTAGCDKHEFRADDLQSQARGLPWVMAKALQSRQ